MAQNAEDMALTGQSEAVVDHATDPASKTQAETITTTASEALLIPDSAEEDVGHASDQLQTTMPPPSTAEANTPVQNAATNATEEDLATPSDGNAGVGPSALLSDVASEAPMSAPQDPSPSAVSLGVPMPTNETPADRLAPDQSSQSMAMDVTNAGQDSLPLTGAMSSQASIPSASHVNVGEHAQDSTPGHDNSHNEQTVSVNEQATDQLQESNPGLTESAAAAHVSETGPAHMYSDIEEGEELGSPPPPPRDQQDAPQARHTRSLSNATSRKREGRSRSPDRERRPCPQRAPVKAPINRDELFKVYIGGLPERTERVDLEDCFGQFGEIGHIELKLGYAFIEFVTQEGAAEAIETYNEGHFLGKMIKVEASKSATTQQESIDKGTCFTCGEHGHFAKHCPKDPRNANRRRAPIRDRSPPPFARDRRDFRDRDSDRDRPYSARDRDRDYPRRDFDRDDLRRFPPRDDRLESDRRRERDYDRERSHRDFDRSRGPGDRYVEPYTRDSRRAASIGTEPSALSEREVLDQQRDRERQLRRMAEMDSRSVPPPLAGSPGYPPRGAPTDPGVFPPGPPPHLAGSPYYTSYGSAQMPPSYPPPLRSVPSSASYGVSSSIPGPSASPPLPHYPPRGDTHGPYGAPAPYPGNGPSEAYYRSNGRQPAREDQNGGYRNRESSFERRDRFEERNGSYPVRGQDFLLGEVPPYPPRGNDRPPTDSMIPPNVPPYYYDRPPPHWNTAPSDRQGPGSRPLDPYGRAVPSYSPGGPPNQDYNSYRGGSGDHRGYEVHRERR